MINYDIILVISSFLELKYFKKMFLLIKETKFNNSLKYILLTRKISKILHLNSNSLSIINETKYSWDFLNNFNSFISDKMKCYENDNLINLKKITINNYQLCYRHTLGGNRCVVGNFSLFSEKSLPSICLLKKKNGYSLFKSFVSYFEITVDKNTISSLPGCVSIGVCNNNFPLFGKQPGWDSNSYGYHSDDGKYFHNNVGEIISQFGEGDTVGCGIQVNKEKNSLFFTKNGFIISKFYNINDKEKTFYPVIGIDSHHLVNVNFGNKPFCFNLYNYNLSIIEKNMLDSEIIIKNKKKYYNLLPENTINTINYLSNNSSFTNQRLENMIALQNFIFYPDLFDYDEDQTEQITND